MIFITYNTLVFARSGKFKLDSLFKKFAILAKNGVLPYKTLRHEYHEF